MFRKTIKRLANSAATLLLTACTLAVPAPLPTPTPLPYNLQPPIDAGLRFLEGQYNADLGLLQESPSIRPDNYFLANDALLAAHVFETMGDPDLAAALRTTLAQYAIAGNQFIEVAWGETIPWPPLHYEDPGSLVTSLGDARILTIRHAGPGYFYDWSAYSNLACMAVINEYNQGYMESARRLYAMQMSTFDGHGWPDLAYHARDGVYETLGLAWCLYAGALLGEPVDRVLPALLDQQDPARGGFHTHYRADEARLADANVETTSLALLALYTLSMQQTTRLGFPSDARP